MVASPLWRARATINAIDKRVSAIQREIRTRGERGIGAGALEAQVETLRRQASKAASRVGYQ